MSFILARGGWLGAGNRVTKDALTSEESMYLMPREGVLNLGVVWCRACRKSITGVLAVPSGEILTHHGVSGPSPVCGYSLSLRAFVVLWVWGLPAHSLCLENCAVQSG